MRRQTRRDIGFLVGLAAGAVLLVAGIVRDEVGLITSGAGALLAADNWGRPAPQTRSDDEE